MFLQSAVSERFWRARHLKISHFVFENKIMFLIDKVSWINVRYFGEYKKLFIAFICTVYCIKFDSKFIVQTSRVGTGCYNNHIFNRNVWCKGGVEVQTTGKGAQAIWAFFLLQNFSVIPQNSYAILFLRQLLRDCIKKNSFLKSLTCNRNF